MMKTITILLISALLFFSFSSERIHKTISAQKLFVKKDTNSFKPGAVWYDENGEVINAHGGGVLLVNNTYYWFGEKRGRHASEGVNVYSSKDLYHWKYEGVAL